MTATTETTTTPNQFLLLTQMKLTDLPRLGAPWIGQGGLFTGLVRGRNGEPDYLLILGPEHDDELGWQAAMDWAAGLEIEGHQDFSLPTRAEQAVLFGNAREEFKRDGYWSCEQDAGYAWVQGFYYSNQTNSRKGIGWRARAVRRLIIQ